MFSSVVLDFSGEKENKKQRMTIQQRGTNIIRLSSFRRRDSFVFGAEDELSATLFSIGSCIWKDFLSDFVI